MLETARSVEAPSAFGRSVLEGLAGRPKRLEAKYFYDETGSRLFDRICELDEYYVTRAEIEILRAAGPEIAEAVGPGALVFEPGSGAGVKCRILLDALDSPAAFVPADISAGHLRRSAAALAQAYPDLVVRPLELDFTRDFALPLRPPDGGAVVVFFPGSTIGNFEPAAARRFLDRLGRATGATHLLIGVDVKKDEATLRRAYDDAKGVTAAFNLNLLTRINRELQGDFDVRRFRHLIRYDRQLGRIEMHLESLARQTVRVLGRAVRFEAGETIHTENSYKYAVGEFHDLAGAACWRAERTWTGPHDLFSVHLMTRAATA